MDFLDKTLKTFFKRANIYEKHTNWVNLDKCIEPMILDVFGDGLAIDLCAGTGAISKALNKKGWNVMSMDISKEMLSQNALPLSIIGDIQAIPTLDKHFDLVVCRQGLQYVDIKKALYEMKRICKGKIILGHITKEKEDKYDFWTEYFKIASPGRKHIFEPEYIEKKAQELGMRVIDRKIIHQSDYYVGPLLHLDEEKQNYLISLILNTTTDFKNMYNVQITDANDIMYSNRWEFITIQLN